MALQSIQLSTNIGTGDKLAGDLLADGVTYVQYVKLIVGTADSEVPLPTGAGTEANCLRVALATDSTGLVALTTSTANIGKVILSGSVGVTASDICKAEDAAHASGDVGVMLLAVRKATPVDLSGTDGDYEPLQIDNGLLHVGAQGLVAHNAVDAGNPVKWGAKAKSPDGTSTGVVAEDDRTDLYADLNGRLLVNTVAPEFVHAVDLQTSAQTDTALISAPGASHRLMITDIIISAAAAQTIKFVRNTTSSADVLEIIDMAANTTESFHFGTPIPITANQDFGYTSTTTASTGITVTGYIADV